MNEEIINKFWGLIEKSDSSYGCWNWMGFLDKSGLPIIRAVVEGKLKEYSPRKVSMHLAGIDVSEKKHCLAKCGNKLCVNPEHLVRGDEARFWSRVQKLNEPDGCWIWIGSEDKNGYGKFKISQDGKDIHTKAHRYSWQIYADRKPPDNLLVCHKCDNPRCVNPHHLFLGTNQDNTHDRTTKGRSYSKLSQHQVIDIKSQYQNGKTINELSILFDVHRTTIENIVDNNSWRWL